jgi:hypothetical protein
MRKISTQVLFVGLAIIALMASSAREGRAESLKLPPGTKVSIQGQTARINGGAGGTGVSGSYDCSCFAGKGTCTVWNSEGSLGCAKSAGPGACSTECKLVVFTTGVSGSTPARGKSPGNTVAPGVNDRVPAQQAR